MAESFFDAAGGGGAEFRLCGRRVAADKPAVGESFASAEATFFRPASKESKGAPTQKERWLSRTAVFF